MVWLVIGVVGLSSLWVASVLGRWCGWKASWAETSREAGDGAPQFPAFLPTLTSLSDDCGLETQAKQWFPPPSRFWSWPLSQQQAADCSECIVDSSQTGCVGTKVSLSGLWLPFVSSVFFFSFNALVDQLRSFIASWLNFGRPHVLEICWHYFSSIDFQKHLLMILRVLFVPENTS